MRSTTCYLVLDADGLSAFHATRHGTNQCGHFPATEEGLTHFREFLTVDRQQRYILLTNLAEEACFTDTLPALSRSERRDLLTRRRHRLFPDSLWHTSLLTGKNQVTHLGFPQPGRLTPWLSALQDSQSRLQTVNTLSQLFPIWLQIGPRNAGPALIISQHGQRIRQTAIGPHHQLLATQLIEDGPMADDAIARFRQRPEVQSRIPASSPGYILGEHAFTQRWPGQAIVLPDTDASRCLITHAVRHWPSPQLAPAEWLARDREARLSGHLYVSAAISGILSIALASWLYDSIQSLDARIAESTRQRAQYQAQQQAVLAEIAQFPVAIEDARRLEKTLPMLKTAAARFPRALQHLSQALDAQPSVQLDRISWKLPPAPESTVRTAELSLDFSLPQGMRSDIAEAIGGLSHRLGNDFKVIGTERLTTDSTPRFRLQLRPRTS